MQPKLEDLVNFIYLLYSFLRSFIKTIFEATIAKGSPELAAKFSDATTMLIALTSLWLIFELFEAGRKIVRIIVILGWVLLIISIAIALKIF